MLSMVGYSLGYLAINATIPYAITTAACYLSNQKISTIRNQFHKNMENLRIKNHAPRLPTEEKWSSQDTSNFFSQINEIKTYLPPSSFEEIKEILETHWKGIRSLHARTFIVTAFLLGVYGTLAFSTYFHFPISTAAYMIASPQVRKGWGALFMVGMGLAFISGILPINQLKEATDFEECKKGKEYFFDIIEAILNDPQSDNASLQNPSNPLTNLESSTAPQGGSPSNSSQQLSDKKEARKEKSAPSHSNMDDVD